MCWALLWLENGQLQDTLWAEICRLIYYEAHVVCTIYIQNKTSKYSLIQVFTRIHVMLESNFRCGKLTKQSDRGLPVIWATTASLVYMVQDLQNGLSFNLKLDISSPTFVPIQTHTCTCFLQYQPKWVPTSNRTQNHLQIRGVVTRVKGHWLVSLVLHLGSQCS